MVYEGLNVSVVQRVTDVLVNANLNLETDGTTLLNTVFETVETATTSSYMVTVIFKFLPCYCYCIELNRVLLFVRYCTQLIAILHFYVNGTDRFGQVGRCYVRNLYVTINELNV